jgi:signal peptidase I
MGVCAVHSSSCESVPVTSSADDETVPGTRPLASPHRPDEPAAHTFSGVSAGPPAGGEPVAADDNERVEHEPASPAERSEAPRRGTAKSLLKETAIILVSALVLSWLIKTFLVQAFFIPSSSMHDTLIEDDRIMVSKLTPGPFDLERGDIVVFKDPGDWLNEVPPADPTAWRRAANEVLTFVGLYPQDAGSHLVKRVIGLPGDIVACAGPGEPVTVNGVELDEPYLAEGAIPSQMKFKATVPANSLWVMGDNRQHSADSRYHQGEPGGGSIPIENVVGKAFVTVWPLDRATILRTPDETFEDVPDPS